MSTDQRPRGFRHVSAASLDTNASGIAESTISLGLSRFPEPPSSIPSSPLHSKFENQSPRSTVNESPFASNSQSFHRTPQPAKPSFPPSSIHRYAKSHKSTKPGDVQEANPSPFDWHDGASSIDVDEREERLLPTSFITSLLQENKQSRKGDRASFASEALSGISEMTYPPISRLPVANHQSAAHNNSGRASGSEARRQAAQGITVSSNRISGDSDTLHSVQGYPAIVRTADVRRSTSTPSGLPVVGLASATIRSISTASQTSSLQDTETIGSFTKGYQNKLSTTYESGEELLYDYHKFNDTYSNTSPTPAAQRQPRGGDNDPFRRNSMHSQRSVAPSFISRISQFSRRPFAKWKTAKPLPPVPVLPHIPLPAEDAYRKQEQSTPLPELVNRAGRLRDLLDRGQYAHRSVSSYQGLQSLNDGIPDAYPVRPRENEPSNTLGHVSRQEKTYSPAPSFWQGKRRFIIFFVAIFIVIAAVAVGVGVSLSRKHNTSTTCPDNLVGALCNLDATCVCTSSSGCNGIAQNLINILPAMNGYFGANFTPSTAYNSIWMTQGSSATNSCASQATLVDTGRLLSEAEHPNRIQWAQAAMLWNVLMTQDVGSSQKMKSFVQSLPWENLNGVDGPTTADPTFETIISGYSYNFASQTLTEPPADFVTLGRPSNEQIAKLSSAAVTALDRMYAFAQASATQRQTALKKYWTTVLLRSGNDLAPFKAALAASPVMLPFNATSAQLTSLIGQSPSKSFPPALACYPQLNNSLIAQLSSFESTVFGLPALSGQTQFDSACSKDRPIYGVLDVLRLRLPFLDSTPSTVKQAAILNRDTLPRTILYNGPVFSAISTGNAAQKVAANNDPRQFGTPILSDHVILQYLLSMPNINIANALVQFVLNTTQAPGPPDSASLLFSSLNSLPSLEVAIFGDVEPSDTTSTVSSFANPSGSLFFGSQEGNIFRNWTINTIGGPVMWTLNSTSPLIVRDKSLSAQTTISQTWSGAAAAIALHNTSIDGPFIANVLKGTGDFSA